GRRARLRDGPLEHEPRALSPPAPRRGAHHADRRRATRLDDADSKDRYAQDHGVSERGSRLRASGSRTLRALACAALMAGGSPTPGVVAPPPPPREEPKPAPPPPPPREIAFGPLVITLSASRTAQVFHAVDAMSAWGPEAKRAPYAAWAREELALDD